MIFSSLFFLFTFLPLALGLYFVMPRSRVIWRNSVLLVCSLFFYAWGEPVYVLLMLASIGINFALGLWLHAEKRSDGHPKRILVVAVVVNLAMLAFFKYADFLLQSLGRCFDIEMPMLNLPLPIGISFYTFQALSYILDLYRGEVEVQRSIVSFGTYVALFPQLIAGPIVRMQTVAGELAYRQESYAEFSAGAQRFVCGLCKKVLLANPAGEIWKAVSVVDVAVLPAGTAWLGLAAFTFQIYFDFSGYSDMAIGLGRMFGFHFPENFAYPYLSQSITEFWRRWHISLSTWFREYVYIPLGGNRHGILRQLRNLLVVWLLTGIWHGAGWNFVVWGLYFGVLLAAEKLFLLRLLQKLPSVFRHVYTMLLVMLSWAVFAFDSLAQGLSYIAALFGGTGLPAVDGSTIYWTYSNVVLLVLLMLGCSRLPKKLWDRLTVRLAAHPVAACTLEISAVTAGMVLCVAFLVDASYNPFLYFRF